LGENFTFGIYWVSLKFSFKLERFWGKIWGGLGFKRKGLGVNLRETFLTPKGKEGKGTPQGGGGFYFPPKYLTREFWGGNGYFGNGKGGCFKKPKPLLGGNFPFGGREREPQIFIFGALPNIFGGFPQRGGFNWEFFLRV